MVTNTIQINRTPLPHTKAFYWFHPAINPRIEYIASLIEQKFGYKVSLETSRKKKFTRSSILRKNELIITFGTKNRSLIDVCHELSHFIFSNPKDRTKKNYGMSFEFNVEHNEEHLIQEVMASIVGCRLASNIDQQHGMQWILGTCHKYSGRQATYICACPPHVEVQEYVETPGGWELQYRPETMIRFNRDNMDKITDRLKNYYESNCKIDPKFPYDHVRHPNDEDYKLMAKVNVEAIERLLKLNVLNQNDNYWITDPKTWKVWDNK